MTDISLLLKSAIPPRHYYNGKPFLKIILNRKCSITLVFTSSTLGYQPIDKSQDRTLTMLEWLIDPLWGLQSFIRGARLVGKANSFNCECWDFHLMYATLIF